MFKKKLVIISCSLLAACGTAAKKDQQAPDTQPEKLSALELKEVDAPKNIIQILDQEGRLIKTTVTSNEISTLSDKELIERSLDSGSDQSISLEPLTSDDTMEQSSNSFYWGWGRPYYVGSYYYVPYYYGNTYYWGPYYARSYYMGYAYRRGYHNGFRNGYETGFQDGRNEGTGEPGEPGEPDQRREQPETQINRSDRPSDADNKTNETYQPSGDGNNRTAEQNPVNRSSVR